MPSPIAPNCGGSRMLDSGWHHPVVVDCRTVRPRDGDRGSISRKRRTPPEKSGGVFVCASGLMQYNRDMECILAVEYGPSYAKPPAEFYYCAVAACGLYLVFLRWRLKMRRKREA